VSIAASLFAAGIASANIHSWNDRKRSGNTDASIHFVERAEIDGSPGHPHANNDSISSHPQSVSFDPGAVTQPPPATGAIESNPSHPTVSNLANPAIWLLGALMLSSSLTTMLRINRGSEPSAHRPNAANRVT